MESFCVLLLVVFCHLACPRPLLRDAPAKQDVINSEDHNRVCIDFRCILNSILQTKQYANRDVESRQKLNHNVEISNPMKAYSKAPYQHRLIKRSIDEDEMRIHVHDVHHFMNHKSAKSNLNDEHSFDNVKVGKQTDASSSGILDVGNSKPIKTSHHNSDDTESDDDQGPLYISMAGLLGRARRYCVRKIARLMTMYPQLIKYPIPRAAGPSHLREDPISIADKLRDVSKLTLSELLHLLHAMQHHVRPTPSAGISLHNICCDIG
ncbi:uncharacterized protein LOC121382694 [Gigantopelta aegis]|uniref:uncharacterized protein LOC121382694 n=1 Tax=Gigantopelta aegis TaxID=1735272 RepID=UPI001B889E58|nr:uncharacterized protein LOC121382694 [Gigantopelta aegis]